MYFILKNINIVWLLLKVVCFQKPTFLYLFYSASAELPPHKEKKYIVHEDQLLGLFRTCPVCSRSCVIDTATVGTLLRVKQKCTRCEYFKEWSSQPTVNSIPAGNLQLCAAVLFTGSSFRQVSKVKSINNPWFDQVSISTFSNILILQFLRAFNIQGLSEQSFYRHQGKLLIPTVNWQWKLEQDDLIMEAVGGGAVTLGGDMRADSPGKFFIKLWTHTRMSVKVSLFLL